MPNRIVDKVNHLDAIGVNSLSVVLMLGDPDFDTTLELVDIAVAQGVDILELGIPIDDPFLDSSTMQASMKRAIEHCSDPRRYLRALAEVRQAFPDLPIELMVYRETLETIGIQDYAEGLRKADLDATLVADAFSHPQTFRDRLDDALLPLGILPIRFVPEPYRRYHLEDVRENARGFVVVQTTTGPHGHRRTVYPENIEKLRAVRAVGVDLPLVLAYGIKTPAHIRRCIELGADGVLIGTAVLETAHRSRTELSELLAAYREAAGPTNGRGVEQS